MSYRDDFNTVGEKAMKGSRATLAILALLICIPLGADDSLKDSTDRLENTVKALGPAVQLHLNEAYRDGALQVLDVLIREFDRQPEGSSYDRETLLKTFRDMRRVTTKVSVAPRAKQ